MLPPDTESPAERHFIEMATRSLEGQPEVRDEARGELMERLSRQNPVTREAMAEAAVARLAKSEPQRWTPKAITLAVAWVVLTGIWVYFNYFSYQLAEEFDTTWQTATSIHKPATTDPAAITDPADFEALLNSESGHFSTSSPDYRTTWMRLDEGNGAWSWREALVLAQEALRPGGSATPEEKMAEAWQRIEEAARAPRFKVWQPERDAAQIAALGAPKDGLENVIRAGGGVYRWFHHMGNARDLPKNVVAARAKVLVEAKDQEGLRQAICDWETLCVRLSADALKADDLLPAANLIAAGEPLSAAAGDLGMRAEKERLDLQMQGMASGDPDSFPTSHNPAAGMMVQTLYGLEQNLPEAEWRPGRMVEFTLVERVLVLAGAPLLLLALALVAIESVRRGRRVNGLANGLGPLFNGEDGLWLIGLGVLAPFAWYWGITRLTPLGCRDVGFFHFHYPPTVFQGGAGVLLLLVAIVQTGQWRIARRGQLLGLGPRMLWPGWLVLAIAALAVPAGGIGRFLNSRDIDQYYLMFAATCGIPLLWLLWRGGALIFGPKSNALGGVLLARASALPLALAVAALVACYPLLLSQEKNWLAQDRVTGWDLKHGTTYFEARSVEAYRTKCRELFSKAESP